MFKNLIIFFLENWGQIGLFRFKYVGYYILTRFGSFKILFLFLEGSENTAIWLHDVVNSSYITNEMLRDGPKIRMFDEKTDQVKWEKHLGHTENVLGLNGKYLTTQRDIVNQGFENQVYDLETGQCVFTMEKIP